MCVYVHMYMCVYIHTYIIYIPFPSGVSPGPWGQSLVKAAEKYIGIHINLNKLSVSHYEVTYLDKYEHSDSIHGCWITMRWMIKILADRTMLWQVFPAISMVMMNYKSVKVDSVNEKMFPHL